MRVALLFPGWLGRRSTLPRAWYRSRWLEIGPRAQACPTSRCQRHKAETWKRSSKKWPAACPEQKDCGKAKSWLQNWWALSWEGFPTQIQIIARTYTYVYIYIYYTYNVCISEEYVYIYIYTFFDYIDILI